MGSSKAPKNMCEFVFVCIRKHREEERKCVTVWRRSECECARMFWRKKETPSAIPVCWLLWLVVLRLHAAWIMLELQPVFPREREKKSL